MRVLHIIQKLDHGGGQRTLYNIVRENVNICHRIVTFLCCDEYNNLFTKLSNVELIIINNLVDYKKIIRNMDYDIVNYHWWPGLYVFGCFFQQRRIPVVLTLQEQCRPPLYDFYYVAGSKNNFRYLAEVSSEKKEIIYLGIDISSIERKKDMELLNDTEVIIGRVSTIISTKIPPNLFEVYSAIKVDNRKMKFMVCGTGDEKLVKKLNIEKYKYLDCDITIDTDSNVSNKYKQMDVFVYWLPEGESESFGLVIIEAMASGVPVIAQNKGALNEIIQHGVNGFLFENEDEINIYVKRLVSDKDLRKRIISNAQIMVNEFFSAKRMAEDYAALYKRLICETRNV